MLAGCSHFAVHSHQNNVKAVLVHLLTIHMNVIPEKKAIKRAGTDTRNTICFWVLICWSRDNWA